MIRVVVIDEHPLYRAALRLLFTAAGDIDIVGEAVGSAEGADLVTLLQPDVVVIDSRLPDGSGIGLCGELRVAHPSVACLILTAVHDRVELVEAIVADAAAYLAKSPRGDDIVRAVRAIAQGEVVIGEALDPPRHTPPRRRRSTNGRHR